MKPKTSSNVPKFTRQTCEKFPSILRDLFCRYLNSKVAILSNSVYYFLSEGQTNPLQKILSGNNDNLSEIKLSTSVGSSKKQDSSRKKIYFWFIDYAKAFDCVDHNKLWKILQEMGISDHLTCLLRNVYAGKEATVRTGHGTTDWFQIGKGVRQGCVLSPCLFNFYAEYIMRNAGLEEAQVGIQIAGRNINNLRYVDDTPLW